MTLYKFIQLSKDEQLAALNEEGVIVSERRSVLNRYFLHQLGSFYVEVKYNIELDSIQCVKPFSATAELEPYLKMINIKDLLKVS